MIRQNWTNTQYYLIFVIRKGYLPILITKIELHNIKDYLIKILYITGL